jgi:hypothetical protein
LTALLTALIKKICDFSFSLINSLDIYPNVEQKNGDAVRKTAGCARDEVSEEVKGRVKAQRKRLNMVRLQDALDEAAALPRPGRRIDFPCQGA